MGRAAVALLALSFAACNSGTVVRVDLPPTPQLFGSLPWAMVNVTYSKGFSAPDPDTAVIAVLRGGDVVNVLKRGALQERQGSTTDYWYQVKMDDQVFWVFGAQLTMFGLEMQARTSASIIQDKLFGNPPPPPAKQAGKDAAASPAPARPTAGPSDKPKN
jgi:hypothetical protein